MTDDDAELVSRILEQDDGTAKEELVRRHQTAVVRLVASVLGPARRHQVEDVSQEAFLRVYRSLESFRFRSSLSTWIHRVAYSCAIDFLRRPARRDEEMDEHQPTAEAAAPDPLDLAIRRQTAEAVSRALERLPAIHRSALLLYYWYELPVAEIAGLLGVGDGTVKSYLHRGRRRLGRLLKKGVGRA